MTTITRTPSSGGTTAFLFKWTPRAIAVAIGGYYGLGIAYECGLMALIDQVAIQVIKHFAGYAGIGAFMPTVQWYAALGARITIGLCVGVIYDLVERSLFYLGRRCHEIALKQNT